MNQYHVVMEADPRFWQNPDGLKYIYVKGTGGKQVPLSAFTRYESDQRTAVRQSPGPVSRGDHFLQSSAPERALGDAVPVIEDAERDIGLPSTIHGSFQGTAQAYQESLANEPILIAAALLTVYIVLGMLYESMIHPITILSTLPSAGVGALLALLITHNELDVISLHRHHPADRHREEERDHDDRFRHRGGAREGKSPEDAIFQACMLRFRPIIMTTMAAMLGGLPLALGTGVGSELRRPLGSRSSAG